MNKQLFGAVLASSVAFAMNVKAEEGKKEVPAPKSAAKAAKAEMACQNNSCKGHADACKCFGNNSCKGQNACKGHGCVDAKDEAACTTKKGTWTAKK